MTVPTKKEILKKFESMSYSERVKSMSLLGYREKNNVHLKNLLDEMEKGDDYEVSLSLFASIAAGCEERIIKGIKNESNLIKNLAVSAFFPVVKSDDFLLNEFFNLPGDTRKRLLAKIYLYKKRDLAEKLFLPVLEKCGENEALVLLPLCKKETVAKYLEERGDTIRAWRKIAKEKPEVLMNYFKEKVKGTPLRYQIQLWARFYSAVEYLSKDHAGEILGLALKYCPENMMPDSILNNFKIFVKREPDLLFPLLTRPAFKSVMRQNFSFTYYYHIGGDYRVLKNIRFFKKDYIIEIARILLESPQGLVNLFENLKPSLRGEVFDKACEGVNLENYEWPDNLLSLLPCDIRYREAERMISLRKVKEKPGRITELKAFCNITDVREDLYKEVKAAEAEDRIRALKSLIKATLLCRKELGETLRYLERIKNEQDPVRASVFSALSEMKPSLFREEYVELLEKLGECVFEARDTSYMTRQSLQKIALSLLCYNAKNPENKIFLSSLNILKKLAGQWGSLSLPDLESYLPAGTEYKIVEVLKPIIKAQNERESYSLIITLATSLGKKGWYIKELQDMLFTVIKGKPDTIALQAINLWLNCPKTRGERVEKLLQKDRSVIVSPYVLKYIHYKRQDLLNYYLTGKPVRGKFLTGNTLYVLPVEEGFYRWLPAQQKKFAGILEKVTGDKERDIYNRRKHIKILARIPVTTLETLREYLNDCDVNIVEGALGAMIWLKEPGSAFPVLSDYLDSDRARVAMYAMARSLDFLPPLRVRENLISLLERPRLKVTVHKEILRLLGKFRADMDCSVLKKEWDKADLHRDVRIAVLHSAGRLMDSPSARALLQEGINSSDFYIVKSLIGRKADTLSLKERKNYVTLLLKALENKDYRVRMGVFINLNQWLPGSEDIIGKASSRAILNIEEGSEWRYALGVLVEAGRVGKAGEEIIKTVKTLMDVPVTGETDKRDLPHRQRLIAILDSFIRFPYIERMQVASFISELSDIITCPDLWPYRAGLKLSSLCWDRVEEVVNVTRELIGELDDKFYLFNNIRCHITGSLSDNTLDLNMEVLLEIIDNFIKASEEEQLIALSVLKIAGDKRKWDGECCERLKILRNSCFISVKFEAGGVWTVVD